MIEFPLDQLRNIANEANDKLDYWRELFDNASPTTTDYQLGAVAVILNTAIDAGVVTLPATKVDDARLLSLENVYDTGYKLGYEDGATLPQATIDPYAPDHYAEQDAIATPDASRHKLPDPDVARARIALAIASGKFDFTPRARARAGQSSCGNHLPTVEEMVAEIQKQAMAGIMPTMPAFNAAKPSNWATAQAQIIRLDTSWESFAQLAGLKPNPRGTVSNRKAVSA